MDFPSKIDIEYLIDAAEKTSHVKGIPEYITYILYEEAKKLLDKQGTADYTADLESRIRKGLSPLSDKDIPECPEEYRENDSTIQVLVKFYRKYNEKNKIDEIRKEDDKHKKWGILCANFQVLEGRSAMRERILTASKALRTALKMLYLVAQKNLPEEEFTQIEIPEEFLQDTKYDEEGSNETYNIIPFDGRPDLLPEVNYAINQLKLVGARLFSTGEGDVLNRLEKIFKFQKSSVSNQRENIVSLLSNEQMRLCTPGEHKKVFNEALGKVFWKTLDNYVKWCRYLHIDPIWKNFYNTDVRAISKEKKIVYISLYYLIWGEAANVRFLPECLCYIFHHMGKQLDDKDQIRSVSFIQEVIHPLYEVIAAEAKINSKRDAPHSTWRNYDDFNEYFWSPDCFQLGWPLNINSPFFQKPSEGSTVFGKTSFIERRTFWHLYHSFHRMWIFHVMMFQALVIIAFNDEMLNSKTLREILSVGPTYFLMKLIQSMLDIVLKDGAHSNTSRADVLRIRFCIILFRALCFMSTLIIFFVGIFRKYLQEKTSSVEESIVFYACIVVLVIYACIIKWINQLEEYVVLRVDEKLLDSYLKEEYVGRVMDEKRTDYIGYMYLWIITLAMHFAYTYYYLIEPLVRPTRDITDVSKNIHNMLAIGSLWAGVICAYIVGSHVVYNAVSAYFGTLVGGWDGVDLIQSFGHVCKYFDYIPESFMDRLNIRKYPTENNNPEDVKKLVAAEFSPFWNQIVMNLREEDYISDLEQFALSMPEKSGCIDVVQWPPFLLANKVSLAIEIAAKSVPQKDMWDEIKSDVYMKYAVEECFHSVEFILSSSFDGQGRVWVERIYGRIRQSIAARNLDTTFQLNKLASIIKEISELTEALEQESRPPEPLEILDQEQRHFEARRRSQNKAKNALKLKNGAKNLYNVIQSDFLREIEAEWIEFGDFEWPINEHPELRSQIRRLHVLLNVKSADHVPRNREARRRLEFFTNSLFMSMPAAKPVREMLSFSVLTPYYNEAVLYTIPEILESNDDGVTLLDYLKNLYPDEWNNYCERMKQRDIDNPEDEDLELRLWASYRGQTLARTVRGTMYYQKALLLQAYREEILNAEGSESQSLNERFDEVKAHVDLKFTYVVTCQMYGKQKREAKEVAADIAFLLKRNGGLRVAFVDQVNDEFYSKLVKSTNGIETEVYSIKLPGNPILGEGKPENQNHAIVFTRGNAIQTIDMNQDNYFEESLKMRNLLEEFHREPGIPPPTILGIREHIFTESASSLASFMSNQETSFVTLGQRVMANPLKVRMHYGHPDVFDRVFHITWGGISKASRGINISEDIYAGLNSTLRQGSVTHHEYIQVGKGRDVGFNQIATFEGKVAGGNGEQVLSRDIYRLGQRFDFFRMLSFYYTSVGYYFSSLLMVIILYILLYGNLIMTLSGTRVPHVLNDTDMAPEWFFMIVLLPAIYILLVPYLEQGLEKAVESFLTMFFSFGSIFSAFSLGTRIHWFGRTVIHGGASYQATGRGFVLHHIKFSENYRRYSRSHFVKGMELLFLVVVYIIYGFHSVRAIYNNLLLLGGLILSISWIVAPFLFDSSPFDLNINSEDWEDWNNWRNCKSVLVEESRPVQEGVPAEEGVLVDERVPVEEGIAVEEGIPVEERVPVEEHVPVEESVAVEEHVPVEETVLVKKSVPVDKSWEAWWNKELDHIRTPAGRVIETVLSLRFFIFPLVVAYRLDVQGSKNSLSNCVIPWICLVGILLVYELFLFFLNKKPVIQFFFNNLATICALAFAIAYYYAFGDMLAFTIAIITIVWGFISFFSNNGVGTIGALAIVYYYSAFGDKLAFIIAIITTVWGFLPVSNNGVGIIGALAIVYYYFAFGDKLAFIIAIITTIWGILSFFSNNRIGTIGALAIACSYSPLAFGDMLAFIIAFITTLWGILSICVAWKPALERFSLWTPVKYLAWICDTVMGALMFKIATMFSQRSIKHYLVRNMFVHNVSEYLQKSPQDTAKEDDDDDVYSGDG